MSDDINNDTKIQRLEERCIGIEKRLDDLKGYYGIAGSIIAVIIAVFTFFSGQNFNSEKNLIQSELKDLRQEVKYELGKAQKPARVEFFNFDQERLDGKEIHGSVENLGNDGVKILLNFVIKNTGDGQSKELYIKWYSNPPVELTNKSTDEKDYKYESWTGPKQLDSISLPGGFAISHTQTVYIKKEIPPGKYPMYAKIFSGDSSTITTCKFYIVIN